MTTKVLDIFIKSADGEDLDREEYEMPTEIVDAFMELLDKVSYELIKNN